MPHLVTIDRAHKLLTTLGWSVGEMSYARPDGSGAWQVFCHRDEHKIVAQGHTQKEAWNAALKQAGILQRKRHW